MADADGPPGSDQQEEGGLQAGLNISGTSDKEKHVFKAPAPRQSLLGKRGRRLTSRWASRRSWKALPGPRRRCRQVPTTTAACPPPAAGLDRLAAQKRAEQAKHGSVLGEISG